MKKIIIASHGLLSQGMVETTKMIIGDQCEISYKSLVEGHHPNEIKEEILEEIAGNMEMDYVILTDLMGGSVNNSLMHLAMKENVHVIAGVNLSLVLSIALADESKSIENVIREAVKDAQKNILYTNDLLK